MSAVFLMLFAQTGGRAAPGEALPFAMSYSVTGGYQVAGVDLLPQSATGGFVSGTISMSGVPQNADILAAFMYWETITNGPPDPNAVAATFRGQPITSDHTVSKNSADLGSTFAPCWTSGGGSGAIYYLTMHRADVLQLLPPQLDANGNSTGRRLVNDTDLAANQKLTFSLPEAGTGNQYPQSAGASLFVVYRDPNLAAPLTKVVVYDGLYVQAQGQAMQHTIRGFQDAANSSPFIKMTHIVGSGADNSYDQVYFNGVALPNGLNRFVRTSGGTSDRAWSNPTFDGLSFTAAQQAAQSDNQYGEWVTTSVDHGGHDSPNDCLSWAAIIFSTTVQDTDGDGLTDRLETADNVDGAGVLYGLKEPNDVKLPNLKQMSASPTHRDIFLEVAAMKANPLTTYGSSSAPFNSTTTSLQDLNGHNHLPTPAVWKMLGEAFDSAPTDARYPSAGAGIKLHVDVGPGYHALGGAYASTIADGYLVPANQAKGGESVTEAPCTEPCQFPAFPGTVAWKLGFDLHKNALFDASRNDIFHFALYAHASGLAKSLLPCLDSQGNPTTLNSSGGCTAAINPNFHVPAGVGGRGDLPGGDFIVTLGLWDTVNFVGSDFVQASTTMHELGHNLDLWHGGARSPDNVSGNISFQTNCKPNYLSVMNYLYQLGGLVDLNGVPHLGYSSEVIENVTELSLTDGTPVLPGPYRSSWYAPWQTGMPAPAKRFCNGRKFSDPAPSPMARIDGSPIDWNGDGAFGFGVVSGSTVVSSSQDVNFDGTSDGTFNGSNDWATVRLNQIGSRRNIAGFSLGSTLLSNGSTLLADGSLVLADGSLVLADGSLVLADGSLVLADGSLVLADGSLVLADGSLVLADGSLMLADGALVLADGSLVLADGSLVLADGALVLADGSLVLADGSLVLADGSLVLADGSLVGENIGELSPRAAAESGNLPGPNELKACVIGVDADCSVGPGQPLHRVKLSWKAPTLGTVSKYRIYRALGTTVPPGTQVEITGSPVPGSQLSVVDLEELPFGNSFTYYVIAELTDGNVTGRSNYQTIVAVNDPPVAGVDVLADAYETPQNTPLAVSLPGVLGNDKAGQDSYATSLAASPFTGPTSQGGTVTLNANGSFTYTPKAGFVGTDTFTYAANNGPWARDVTKLLSADSGVVTVTITVKATTYNVTIQPLKTPSKLGSAVPVVFQVTRGGVVLTSTSIVKEIDSSFKPLPSSGVCPAPSTDGIKEVLYKSPDFSTGKSTLRYISSAQSFQFNWDTTSAISLPAPVTGQGCYTVLIYLDDLDAFGNPTGPRLSTVVLLKQ